jgi:arginyl-tRNA synthetase
LADQWLQFPDPQPLFFLPLPDGAQLKIMFSEEAIPRLCLPYIIDRADSYGRGASRGRRDSVAEGLGRRKAVIEFSSPNLASKFEGKHLRSTILGAFIANLHEVMGWDVTRVNYLGDWGKPIGLLGAGWERFGSEEAYEADPLGHLMKVYHQIHELFDPQLAASKKARDDALHGKAPEGGKDQAQIESEGLFAERDAFFKRMEDREDKAIALWKRVRNESIKSYVKLYAQMGINFDDYSGESQVSSETMTEVEELLKSKGLCEEGGGSLSIDLKKYKLSIATIRDPSGSTYLLRDIAAVLERAKKYSFDKMVYVVAADHKEHFSRVIKILELIGMPELAGKLQHVSFNQTSRMVEQLDDREPTLDKILDRCQNAMRESLGINKEKAVLLGDTEETARSIGIGALLAQELSSKRPHLHTFNSSTMSSFEPGTGPYLVWWAARLDYLLSANPEQPKVTDDDWGCFEDEEEMNLLRVLLQWPDIVESVSKALEASVIMGYLTSVTGYLASCFEKLEDCDRPSPAQRMLFQASHIVLKSGLHLVGIVPIQK